MVGPRLRVLMEYVKDDARSVFSVGRAVSATGLEGEGTLCSASEKRDPVRKSL